MGRHRQSPRPSFWLPEHSSPAHGHNQGDTMNILFDMFHIFYTHTKFGIKIFEIDFVIEI